MCPQPRRAADPRQRGPPAGRRPAPSPTRSLRICCLPRPAATSGRSKSCARQPRRRSAAALPKRRSATCDGPARAAARSRPPRGQSRARRGAAAGGRPGGDRGAASRAQRRSTTRRTRAEIATELAGSLGLRTGDEGAAAGRRVTGGDARSGQRARADAARLVAVQVVWGLERMPEVVMPGPKNGRTRRHSQGRMVLRGHGLPLRARAGARSSARATAESVTSGSRPASERTPSPGCRRRAALGGAGARRPRRPGATGCSSFAIEASRRRGVLRVWRRPRHARLLPISPMAI